MAAPGLATTLVSATQRPPAESAGVQLPSAGLWIATALGVGAELVDSGLIARRCLRRPTATARSARPDPNRVLLLRQQLSQTAEGGLCLYTPVRMLWPAWRRVQAEATLSRLVAAF